MEQRKNLSQKLRKICYNLYGDTFFSSDLDIFRMFELGFLDINTFRRYISIYGRKDAYLGNIDTLSPSDPLNFTDSSNFTINS